MHLIDQALQKGSLFRVLLGVALVLFFSVYALLEPGTRFASLGMVILCTGGTWRQYVMWRRLRDQEGVELLGTDPKGPLKRMF